MKTQFDEERKKELLRLLNIALGGTFGSETIQNVIDLLTETDTVKHHPDVKRMLGLVKQVNYINCNCKGDYTCSKCRGRDELCKFISNLTVKPNVRALELMDLISDYGSNPNIDSVKEVRDAYNELRTIFQSGGGVELKCEHKKFNKVNHSNRYCYECGA